MNYTEDIKYKLNEYFNTDIRDTINKFQNISEKELIERSEKNVISNFKIYAPKVKAYVKFLQKHDINIDNIKTIEDFKKLPLTSKENYITKYPLEEIVTNISQISSISSSSGSSGTPIYLGRGSIKDIDNSESMEFLFEYNHGLKDKKTLFMVMVGLGIWSASSQIMTFAYLISYKNNNFSMVTPGLSIEECVKIFKNSIDGNYDQIIIMGYPSFIKDMLDEAILSNINLKKKNIYIYAVGEGVTLGWREYIANLLGKKKDDSCISTLVASSEAGSIAIETNLTKKIIYQINQSKDKLLVEKIFKTKLFPTLAQYNPLSKYVEEVNETVVLTLFDVMPFIRYDTKDRGGIYLLSDLSKKINMEIKDSDLKLPCLYLSGRADVILTIYSVNIYVDNIKNIINSFELLSYITGKFQADVEFDKDLNPMFLLNIEIKKGYTVDTINTTYIKDYIVDNLKYLNSEYSKLHSTFREKVEPIITYEEFAKDNSFATDNKVKFKRTKI
ncbi:MAG: phenylacetate--CoA ligase family protein [Patescibacteria group bacterium]